MRDVRVETSPEEVWRVGIVGAEYSDAWRNSMRPRFYRWVNIVLSVIGIRRSGIFSFYLNLPLPLKLVRYASSFRYREVMVYK